MILKICVQLNINVKIHKFSSGEELINYYKRKKLDILFLDIILGETNGIEIARLLRNSDNKQY